MESVKLNLGCGRDYREDYVNVDIDKTMRANKIFDFEKKFPFKDDSFKYVYSRHVLEHISPRKLLHVMDEIYRICKPNAVVEIHVPHFSCGKTYQSYDHLTSFSYFTFDVKEFFYKFKLLKRRLSFMRAELPYTGNKSLNAIASVINPIFSYIPNKIPFLYERLFCWILPMEEIAFKFKVIKNEN